MDLGGTNNMVVIGCALVAYLIVLYIVLFQNKNRKSVHKNAEKLLERLSNKPTGKSILQSSVSLKKIDKDLRLHSSIISMPSIGRLRERLERTGKKITLKQYLKWTAMYGIGAFLIFKFAFGSSLTVSLLFGVFFALLLPHRKVARLENKRIKKLLLLLPDALDLMVRGLRSGLPVTESMNTIKEEIEDPVKSIFSEITQSVRIGVPFEEALLNMARKLKVNEFNFLVISIALQRETGGNLAEILENLSVTIRARATMKMKIRAITSEARMSAYIVGALPFLVSLALMVISPGYLNILFDDVRGNIALGAAMTSFTFGMFIMRKMGKFEI
jgi:tight adherence protein B